MLVHGSWVDHRVWNAAVADLSDSFRVLSFDRRGHGASEHTQWQGSMEESADDLAALIETLGLAPAHVAGVSWGGSIVLELAARRPELFLSLAVHEPPLFALVADDPDCRAGLLELDRLLGAVVDELLAGHMEAGARLYVDTVAYGPGAWAELSDELRRMYVGNAQTYLDQCLSPGQWSVDLDALSGFLQPALLTQGDQRAVMFGRILDRVAGALPRAERRTLPGTSHAPQLTHPAAYAQAILSFAGKARETVSLR